MTKDQWTELMNDTNLPWPVIIDDTLKQYFTDKVADEVFDQILDAAWYRHLALSHSSKNEKKPDRGDAIEILKDDPEVDTYIVLTANRACEAKCAQYGTGKDLMCLLISGAADLIRHTADDAPDTIKKGVVAEFKKDFIETLNYALEDDDDD